MPVHSTYVARLNGMVASDLIRLNGMVASDLIRLNGMSASDFIFCLHTGRAAHLVVGASKYIVSWRQIEIHRVVVIVA